MEFKLEAERLLIRQFRDSDEESFFVYRNDPEVARYQGWDVPYPRKKVMEFLAEMKSKRPDVRGEWFQAAIEERATSEMIGDVAFFIKNNDPQAYIGFSLARSYWHRGYGMESVHRVLGYLFDDVNLHRVIALTDVENRASYQMLERLGFRREAHFVENLMFKGKWGSEYQYAMLKREWLER